MKCSVKKHEQIDAVIYCQECNQYMCNKCQKYHSELFDSHHLFNIDKDIEEIFTGFCKENNHNKELNYFCKTHNILCCAICLCKIEDRGNGLHKNCDVCIINEIQEEKRNKLKDNIKWLEELSLNLGKTINDLKNVLENINENKEKLKIKIQETFTKIRNEINKREDELLISVDDYYKKIFLDENLVKKSDKLSKEIKESLKRGKIIEEKDWDNNNLNSMINDCIKIENNIKNINIINENIKKHKQNENIKMIVNLEDEEVKDIIDKIKSIGSINEYNKYKFRFQGGLNYTLDNNGLIATKTSGGDCWNCTIIGNKEIPKNKISKWKIKINNFYIKHNTWNVLIGIGPYNKNNELNFYSYCWSFICGNSQLSLKKGSESKYNNGNYERLKAGDIIEVTVDRKEGNLSFSVNNRNYGLTGVKIPENEILYPIILINDEKQSVEIV